jgi:hypothetical protein
MHHCHILDHADMEMMRHMLVVPQGMPTGMHPMPPDRDHDHHHDHG